MDGMLIGLVMLLGVAIIIGSSNVRADDSDYLR